MSDAVTPEKKRESRILKRQAQLLWQLVTTTPGVADLAEPMKRAEYHFDRLSKGQRTTVAVIAKKLAEGFHVIQTQEAKETGAETTTTGAAPQSQAIDAEVIPPNQDEIGDGSGTGD